MLTAFNMHFNCLNQSEYLYDLVAVAQQSHECGLNLE
jgi:hypothetical protein